MPTLSQEWMFEGISIHALREEGDLLSFAVILHMRTFLSTPSARRATEVVPQDTVWTKISIHALREEGDPMSGNVPTSYFSISIHALREEGDRQARLLLPAIRISIHALREEGDFTTISAAMPLQWISIHALREEGDSSVWSLTFHVLYFYPRPPRGGRQTGFLTVY